MQVLFRKACEELLRRLENDNGLRFPSRTKRLPAGYFERCLFKSHGKFPLDSADHDAPQQRAHMKPGRATGELGRPTVSAANQSRNLAVR
jgi:hypothetical protein